jgi:hypothetical protein
MRTTPNRLTNFTPFVMVYGSEVILPSELQYGSSKVQGYQLVEVEQERRDAINLLKELRGIAITRMVRYQQTLR